MADAQYIEYEPQYMGDEAGKCWELEPGYIWVVVLTGVGEDGQQRIEAVFSDLNAAFAYADEWNKTAPVIYGDDAMKADVDSAQLNPECDW